MMFVYVIVCVWVCVFLFILGNELMVLGKKPIVNHNVCKKHDFLFIGMRINWKWAKLYVLTAWGEIITQKLHDQIVNFI